METDLGEEKIYVFYLHRYRPEEGLYRLAGRGFPKGNAGMVGRL